MASIYRWLLNHYTRHYTTHYTTHSTITSDITLDITLATTMKKQQKYYEKKNIMQLIHNTLAIYMHQIHAPDRYSRYIHRYMHQILVPEPDT